jgi:hypothetical protein
MKFNDKLSLNSLLKIIITISMNNVMKRKKKVVTLVSLTFYFNEILPLKY